MLAFLQQLVQHNIRVIQKYYSKIRLERISQLIGVSVERTEKEIGDMVVNKRIQAKINRLSGIVVFSQRKQFTNEKLDGWNHDTKNILDKVEQTCHLINRDRIA
jgi:26S proteasome regulatory subunit N5